MKWFELHPKIKAVAYTLAGIVALDAVAYFNGDVSLKAFLMTAAAGIATFLAGYFKSSNEDIEV